MTLPPTDEDEPRVGVASGAGETAAAISNASVAIMRRHTGHGPTEARTTIDRNLVVVLVREALSQGEAGLVDGDDDARASVMRLRRSYQEAMRAELVDVVQEATGRRVEAFMSANHADPDWAAELFVLAKPERESRRRPAATPDPG